MKNARSDDQPPSFYGNRFLIEDAPSGPFPESGMPALDAMRLVDEELALAQHSGGQTLSGACIQANNTACAASGGTVTRCGLAASPRRATGAHDRIQRAPPGVRA